MADERKGFLTPEQVKIVVKLLNLKGIYGVLAGPILRLIDDLLLEKVKAKIPNAAEVLPTVYLIIDEIFNSLDVPALLAAMEESAKLPENANVA
jgi:hypothetical protein